jgi:uncharacterized membrane protein
MAEMTLQTPQVLLALPLIWGVVILFSWRRRFKPFAAFLTRLAIIVLMVVALTQPILPSPAAEQIDEPQEQLVLLVDQSASLGMVGQEALRAEAAQLAQARENLVTLFFADQAVLVDDPLSSANYVVSSQDNPTLNPEMSNLAEALLVGSEFLKDKPGRLILLSDGIPTAGDDPLAVATRLAQQDIPVDALVLDKNDIRAWSGVQNEVRVVSVSVPPVLREGETYDIEVVLHSEVEAEVTLSLTRNGEILAEDVVPLRAELNRFSFTSEAQDIGPQIFRAAIAADADRQPENNRLSAFAEVYPAPQILVVGSDSDELSRFSALLREVGFETDTLVPPDLPDLLSDLESYDGMILLDVPATSFELEQMMAIQEFVRSLGRGLVMTAGRNSFALGQYEGTPLADLLPVSLEPPPREERPPVALLLIIDHSGSMIEQRRPATRLAMAKEAAIRATDILGPDDLLGVLMFDNRFEWVVPFQHISDGAELINIQQRIGRIPPGGGTRILQALEVALPALVEQETVGARHAVLLSDGKSFDGNQGIEDYNRIVDEALKAKITLSTIAIGEADQELMRHLAERGRGRYHFAATPEELPALTVSESDILRSDALQVGDYGVAIFAPHPLARGLFAPLPTPERNTAPNLKGYLAMTPKPLSEVALQVGPGDPLLSVWGYGLGRVVAWSSDTGGEWATDWRSWPDFGRFWGQVVGYTLPAPGLGLLQLDARIGPDGTVTVIADGVTVTGQPADMAQTVATLLTPGGQEERVRLHQMGPGRYERDLRLPDEGAYQVTVFQSRSGHGEADEEASMGFVLSYPAEYGLPPAGSGAPLLEQIAALTGGRTFTLGQVAALNGPPIAPVENQLSAEPIELWPWFLVAALVLWPVEIALRRWGRLRIQ